jgi:hypothetical protein
VRGSVWDELAEALDEVDPEGGFELGELVGEPDFELDEPDAAWELEEPEAPDLELADPEVPDPDAPDLELVAPEVGDPDVPLDLEVDDAEALPDLEPEAAAELLGDPDFPAVDELEAPAAGFAGVPSFTATSKGPLTPGPKYFAVRS